MVSPCTGLPVHFLLSIVLELAKVTGRGHPLEHSMAVEANQATDWRPEPARTRPVTARSDAPTRPTVPAPVPTSNPSRVQFSSPWDFSPLYWPPRAPVWPCVCRFARSGGLRIRLRTGASGPALEAHFQRPRRDQVIDYYPGLPRSGKRLCVFNTVFSTILFVRRG